MTRSTSPARRRLAIGVMALAIASIGLPSTVIGSADKKTERLWNRSYAKLKLDGQPATYVDVSPAIDALSGQEIEITGPLNATSFSYLTAKKRKQQINGMRRLQSADGAQAIVGNEAVQEPGGRSLYLFFQTEEPLPRGYPGGVRFNIMFYDRNGVPLYPSGVNDVVAGSSRLYTGGQYDGFEPLLVGGTDTIGTPIGARPDYNNAASLVNGAYRNGIWTIEVPVPEGATHFRANIEGVTDGRQVVDWLTTPGGIDTLPLSGPPLPNDACFSGSAFSILDENEEPTQVFLEFQVSLDEPLREEDLAGFIVTSDQGGDPQTIPGGFVVYPGIDVAYGSFTAPVADVTYGIDGWRSRPDGPSVDPGQLIAAGTVAIDGSRSGPFVGRTPCGALDGPNRDAFIAAQMAWEEIITDSDATVAITWFDFPGLDGSDVSVLVDEAAGEPRLFLVAGSLPTDEAGYQRRLGTSFGAVIDAPIGEAGAVEVLPNGMVRIFWYAPFQGPDGPAGFGRTFTVEFPPGDWPNARPSAEGPATLTFEGLFGPMADQVLGAADALDDAYVGGIAPFLRVGSGDGDGAVADG